MINKIIKNDPRGFIIGLCIALIIGAIIIGYIGYGRYNDFQVMKTKYNHCFDNHERGSNEFYCCAACIDQKINQSELQNIYNGITYTDHCICNELVKIW